MQRQSVRPPAVAGTWYAATSDDLARDVDAYLEMAGDMSAAEVCAVVAPHAGLMYSGPVAAWSYRAVASQQFELGVLVGPSHYVAFDGVALDDRDAFETPLGLVRVATQEVDALVQGLARPAV